MLSDFDIGLVAFLTAAWKAFLLIMVGFAMLSAWDLLRAWLRR